MKFLILGLGLLAFSPASANQDINPNPLSVVEASISEAGKNQHQVAIEVGLVKDHHAYVDQFRLKVVHPENFVIGELSISPTVEFFDKFSKKTRVGIENKAVVTAPVHIPPGSGYGETELALTYQACTDDYCLFPKTLSVKAQFLPPKKSAGPSNATANSKDPLEKPSPNSFLKTLEDKGWLLAFLFVFFGGFLTSFTPCIYPMIPITLAVLGARGANRSRWHGLGLSISYVLGIALTYALLGVFAALTGNLFGSFLGHPVVVTAIAALFVGMGLSMYGYFEVKLPDQWATKLAKSQSKGGYSGAFGTGLIAGVVASPCVGPVLVGVLTYVAQTRNALIGFGLLFTFALGMGLIFIILGTFSQLLQRLPRSGAWMNFIKVVFGTVMIAMAYYYVYPVYTHKTFYILLGLGVVALALLASVSLTKSIVDNRWRLIRSVLLILAGFIGGAMIVYAHHPGLLGTKSSSHAKPEWKKFSYEELMTAKNENRPVIVDFKADWCAACKELERYTFSDPEVLKMGTQFTWLAFDATLDSPELSELKSRFNIQGLPMVLFFDADGEWQKDLSVTGFEKPAEFLTRMQKLAPTP
ncbi:MAG: protein-disulfide reductase DsbD [Bdellovibrionales bacterium]|nr:protein-disulfide reductase DsbD [Bdellovibrionales bacterium]